MPRLEIDLDKIEHNARAIVDLCAKEGIEVAGVTKGVGGSPIIARAMLKGGIKKLAEARIMNMQRIKKAKIKTPTLLIRIPRVSRSKEVIRHFDVSLISEWKVIHALSKEALRQNKKHGIILMVDLGDLREGLMMEQVMPMIKRIIKLQGIQLKGIGTNLGCYGGIMPTNENMQMLADLSIKIQKEYNIKLETISGGGSNCLPLVVNGTMPKEINQLRIGEAILLGRESTRDMLIPDTYQDTFKLVSEIIEIKEKPSKPIGEVGADSFGNKPEFEDLGRRRRAIIALGKQDVRLDGLQPLDKNIKIMGGSSDHIILDITDSKNHFDIGGEVEFTLLYPTLLSAITSPYVEHYIKEDEKWIKI